MKINELEVPETKKKHVYFFGPEGRSELAI